jgi:hypothetical protein
LYKDSAEIWLLVCLLLFPIDIHALAAAAEALLESSLLADFGDETAS